MDDGRPARRGRPPLEDEAEISSGQQTRQQRMRLAQRAYRARRQEARESAKSRNEELSRTLDRALAAYSQLHERIIGSLQSGDPTGIPQHLDDAAAQMGAIASGANKALVLRPTAAISGSTDPLGSEVYTSFAESEGSTSSHEQRAAEHSGLFSLAYAASALPDHLGVTSGLRPPTPKHAAARAVISLRTSTPVPAEVPPRMARACHQRVVSMLSGYSHDQPWSPTLTIPLQLLGQDGLMANTLQLLSFFQASVADFQYPVDNAARAPRLFRAVEGGVGTVPRVPAPAVQKIAPGKTRTIIETHFSPLQGKWLEAVDVEEYLEERGISLRNAISTSPSDSSYQPPGSENVLQDPPSVPSATGSAGQELPVDSVTSRIDTTGQLPVVALSADFCGHEPADYTVFERPDTYHSHATIPIRSATGSWDIPSSSQSNIIPSVEKHAPHGGPDVSEITIDLDKLVQLLADKAVCLGPVPGIRKEAVDESIRGSIVPAHAF